MLRRHKPTQNGDDMTELQKTRRGVLFGASALGASAIAAACAPGKTPAGNAADLSSADQLAISQLYSRHFYSIDGLTGILGGKADQNWADTFTADGAFTLVKADGAVVASARGTQALVRIYATFHHNTRHWMNNLLMLPGDGRVHGSCYIIAMDITEFPFRIIRTGLYVDQLVATDGTWKFQSRKLILDPSSPG